MLALSLRASAAGSSASTLVPGLTRISMISTSWKSPMSGSKTSIICATSLSPYHCRVCGRLSLRQMRVGLFGIDLVGLDCLRDQAGVDSPLSASALSAATTT